MVRCDDDQGIRVLRQLVPGFQGPVDAAAAASDRPAHPAPGVSGQIGVVEVEPRRTPGLREARRSSSSIESVTRRGWSPVASAGRRRRAAAVRRRASGRRAAAAGTTTVVATPRRRNSTGSGRRPQPGEGSGAPAPSGRASPAPTPVAERSSAPPRSRWAGPLSRSGAASPLASAR